MATDDLEADGVPSRWLEPYRRRYRTILDSPSSGAIGMSGEDSKAHKPRSYSWELVSFKVEDEVYRIPRHGFTDFSEVFDSMFTVPQPEGPREGQTDDHPIVLPSCTKLEFESLLEVIYPVSKCVNRPPLSKEEWIGVLKLSTMWSMDEARNLAIDKISTLTGNTVERLVLAKAYRIPQWLIDGYFTIVANWSGNRWSMEDLSSELGWETTARLLDLALRAKGPTKEPTYSTVKLTVTCVDCQLDTEVNIPNPIQGDCEVQCPHCRGRVLHASPKVGDPPAKTTPRLRGEALRKAVEDAFKEELASL